MKKNKLNSKNPKYLKQTNEQEVKEKKLISIANGCKAYAVYLK